MMDTGYLGGGFGSIANGQVSTSGVNFYAYNNTEYSGIL